MVEQPQEVQKKGSPVAQGISSEGVLSVVLNLLQRSKLQMNCDSPQA